MFVLRPILFGSMYATPNHNCISHCLENGKANDLPVIKATINVIETLGKETFLDLSTGDHSLTALLDADIEAKTHQDIELVPNMDKIHLFNSESGEAIF